MKKDKDGFVLIFEDGDPMRVEIVKSVLEDAEIDCFVKNAGVQNLFALGSLGGMNPLIGTVKIYVRPEDAEGSRKVLTEAGPAEAAEPPKDEKESGGGFLTRLRRWIVG